MVNNMMLKKVHEDIRGAIYAINFHGKDYEIFEMVKGSVRGGHYHRSDTILILLHGRVLYREMKPEEPSSEHQVILEQGETFRTPARFAHIVTALEDSLIVEIRKGGYEVMNYPAYREIVNRYLEDAKRAHY